MFVLIIIAIVLFIIALVNFGQSKGFFYRLVMKIKGLPVDDEKEQVKAVSSGAGGTVANKEDYEDNAYANDDDQDYLDRSNLKK